jgi:preprotein translocase subunit Sss1
MEHLAQKLSILQNSIFKGVLGKIAGKIIGWKTVASHAFAVAVTTALAALTGGTASFISGAIEKVVQFVSRIFLDAAEKVFLSIVKADFAEFYKYTEKSFYNLLKWFAYALGVIGVMGFIVMIPMMVIIGGISALDNTKIGAIGNGEGSGSGSGGTVPPMENYPVGGCPLVRGYMTTPSYGWDSNTGQYYPASTASGDGYSKTGHGTAHYYAGWGGSCSARLTIPVWAGLQFRSHSESAYPCNTPIKSPFYGFAADFHSADTLPGGNPNPNVYVPELRDSATGEVIQEWSVHSFHSTTGNGDAITLAGTDGTNDYLMAIIHFRSFVTGLSVGNRVSIGDHLGTLYGTPSWQHAHVELSRNGVPMRPELIFCTL